ncbi:MAG: hypothetical protein ACRD8Z_07810 [Nitrososphaeraceae archaeon]
MKSDRNKSINKQYNTTSYYNKQYIHRAMLLSSANKEGITADEIVNRLASRRPPIFLTVRVVYRLLKQLIEEDKVFKSKRYKKYFLKDLFIDDGWSVFAEFLNEFQRQNLLNRISSLEIYSDGHTFHDELENKILNFGNVIGALVTYILVESLRPNERLIPIPERTQILRNFLESAFSLQYVLPSFRRMLPGNADRMIMGTDNESLERIVDACDHVYPGFRELLDNSFRKYISFDWDKTCDHEWHKVFIHKIGERFECRKCLGLVEERDLEP